MWTEDEPSEQRWKREQHRLQHGRGDANILLTAGGQRPRSGTVESGTVGCVEEELSPVRLSAFI